MLLGVQGGGKSLAARAVAGEWGVPLMRLDFGALYNKYYGETERNLRNAFAAAESMSPCVLWIDEIEKGLSTDGGDGDGGVSRRVLGSLLTWMAERREPVFMVATANDISQLPPELVRKGRFDEIFFVDLPSEAARAQIAAIHLKKRGHDPQQFEVEALAKLARGFSGAEIEQAIVSASFEARARGESLRAADILAEIERTRPLSVVMAERIDALRAWASRARRVRGRRAGCGRRRRDAACLRSSSAGSNGRLVGRVEHRAGRPACDGGADDRRDPEQPELLRSPSRRRRAPGRCCVPGSPTCSSPGC